MSMKRSGLHLEGLLVSSHEFAGGPDDYRCRECGRSRIQHQNDGFRPGPGTPAGNVNMSAEASYRGWQVSDRRIDGGK